ncbi:MAG: phosphatase PAP2 family protein [Lutibacter sp.]
MIDYILNQDTQLFIYLNHLGSAQFDGLWLFITNKLSSIPLYLILLYLTYKNFGFKNTVIIVLSVVLLILLSDQTSNFFKFHFKRLRPCHNQLIIDKIRVVKEGCGGLYSFFSGHAINAMAIAIFFGLLLKPIYKYLLFVLLIWAVTIAYSRIYVGVHYPLDVLTGMLFGLIYGSIFYTITVKLILKNKINVYK